MIKNYNCDGAHCLTSTGEIRVLPAGGSSNLLLCRNCFNYELSYREERNLTLAPENKFKLPLWNDLRIYGED